MAGVEAVPLCMPASLLMLVLVIAVTADGNDHDQLECLGRMHRARILRGKLRVDMDICERGAAQFRSCKDSAEPR